MGPGLRPHIIVPFATVDLHGGKVARGNLWSGDNPCTTGTWRILSPVSGCVWLLCQGPVRSDVPQSAVEALETSRDLRPRRVWLQYYPFPLRNESPLRAAQHLA